MSIDLLVVTCIPRTAQPLTEKIMHWLNEQDVASQVLRYGVMQKRQSGFVIIAGRDLPVDLAAILNADSEVEDYVIVAGDDVEQPEEEGNR